MDKKKLRNDIILVGSLLIAAITALLVVIFTRQTNNLVAKVSVQNQVVLTIDLTKENNKDYVVKGINGGVHIHVKDGAIAVTESNCPHQDCVRTGYISDSSHPIICAYNAVTIEIVGNQTNDVEVG